MNVYLACCTTAFIARLVNQSDLTAKRKREIDIERKRETERDRENDQNKQITTLYLVSTEWEFIDVNNADWFIFCCFYFLFYFYVYACVLLLLLHAYVFTIVTGDELQMHKHNQGEQMEGQKSERHWTTAQTESYSYARVFKILASCLHMLHFTWDCKPCNNRICRTGGDCWLHVCITR